MMLHFRDTVRRDTVRRAIPLSLVALLVASAAAQAAPSARSAAPSAARAAAAPAVSQLVGIRASHARGFDRVVFDFAGPLPSRRSVRYVERLLGDASGLPVRIAGQAILRVTFSRAVAHNDAGKTTAPDRVAFALPNAMNVVRAGDFEAVLSYGIGIAKRAPVHVFTLRRPNRVVVDIGTPFRTVFKRVYFFNEPHFVKNVEPYFSSVLRPVLPGTPATGVMDRLFAGPTAAEYARGLRLLRSRATGYAGLSITAPIARVRLTGGCSSGGSTVTIAGEIIPTLKQFPTVSYVKVYDPSGHTGEPTGLRDSIPFCLNP